METVECYCSFSPKKLSRLNSIKPKSKLGSSSGSIASSPRVPKSPVAATFTPPRNSSSRRGRSSPTLSREEELKEVFRRFDGDCDGKISAGELRSYFASIGEYMSYDDALAIIDNLDSDKDHMLDFNDFLRLMEGSNGEEDLKAAFQMFEFERGSGRITPKSLQRVLGQLGESKSYDECVAMIQTFDREGKGEIGYDEFQQMMMA